MRTADIDGGPNSLNFVHEFAEAAPSGPGYRPENDVDARHRDTLGRVNGRKSGAAVAHDVRGDALHELEVHGCAQHRSVVVGVDVDEAGRHGEARGVEDPGCVALRCPDGGDATVLDGDVSGIRWRTGAVDDRPAADHEVEGGFRHDAAEP